MQEDIKEEIVINPKYKIYVVNLQIDDNVVVVADSERSASQEVELEMDDILEKADFGIYATEVKTLEDLPYYLRDSVPYGENELTAIEFMALKKQQDQKREALAIIDKQQLKLNL